MDIGAKLYKKTMLSLADNRLIKKLALRFGEKLAARFIAGGELADALNVIEALGAKGIRTTIDRLGEGIRGMREAAFYRDEYVRLLEKLAELGNGAPGRLLREGDAANVSLKPTQMGLALDAAACLGHIRAIVSAASQVKGFVRIDMENSACTQPTIDLVRRLRTEGWTNAGTVLQASLRRSERDAEELIGEGIPLRLVKGAYKESAAIAYQRPKEIAESFKRMIRLHLDRGVYAAIATHDDAIIRWVRRYAEEKGIGKDAFEFQMLYGLRMGEQERLAREGYRVRCYVPYGTMWYPYFTRRLAEKPAHLWMVLKNARR